MKHYLLLESESKEKLIAVILKICCKDIEGTYEQNECAESIRGTLVKLTGSFIESFILSLPILELDLDVYLFVVFNFFFLYVMFCFFFLLCFSKSPNSDETLESSSLEFSLGERR